MGLDLNRVEKYSDFTGIRMGLHKKRWKLQTMKQRRQTDDATSRQVHAALRVTAAAATLTALCNTWQYFTWLNFKEQPKNVIYFLHSTRHNIWRETIKYKVHATTYNCDLFVLGPELAILRIPRPVWDKLGLNSSLNGFPQ